MVVAGLELDLRLPLLIHIGYRLLVSDWIRGILLLSDFMLVLARLHLHFHVLWEVLRMLLRRSFCSRTGLWICLNSSTNLVQIGIIRRAVNVDSLDSSFGLSFHTSLLLFVSFGLDVLHLNAKYL